MFGKFGSVISNFTDPFDLGLSPVSAVVDDDYTWGKGRTPKPAFDPYGRPLPPEYNPAYNPNTMNLNRGNGAFDRLQQEGMRNGPSRATGMMKSEQERQALMSRDSNAQVAAGSAAKGRSDLAARGGLSSGARERVEQNATNDVLNLNQKTAATKAGNMAQLGINDEQNRLQQLAQASQAKTMSNQFDIGNEINANRDINAWNQNQYNEAMRAYGANQTANAQVQASQGGSSFICTALRDHGLMSLREQVLMTNFMLRSLATCGDFFAWYFGVGKDAIDVANRQKFDFSAIKTQFVDDILDTLEKAGLETAQTLYIERAGAFCQMFLGTDCGYKHSMAEPGLFKSVAALPMVFARLQTWVWLKGYIGSKLQRTARKMKFRVLNLT